MCTTLTILAVAAVLFAYGRLRPDLVAICATLSLVLFNVLTPEEALSGFAHPLVAMMAGLFVVGGGIFGTGLAKRLGAAIVGLAGSNDTRLFVLLMLATAFVGAFVSNTGTVALMIPIVVSLARRARIPVSRLLMPLAFAGSLGGMLTLIGTPPNLIVRDALVEAGYEPLGFFSFTPIGILCLAAGIVVLLPLSKKYLAHRSARDARSVGKTLRQLTKEYSIERRMACVSVSPDSPVIGYTPRELDVHRRYGLTIIEVRRQGMQGLRVLNRVEQYALADVPLQGGDELYVSGPAERVTTFCAEQGLKQSAQDAAEPMLHFYDVGLAEVLLLPAASVVGQTVEEADFRQTYGLNILGIRRQDTYLLDHIKHRRLQASDILLVQGPWKHMERLSRLDGKEWVVIGRPSEQASRVTLDYKAPLAGVIMLLMVVCMAWDVIPIAPVTAVVVAAVAMIATGCVRGVEAAYKAIDWGSLILFGAMLPMSTALEKTGATHYLSIALVDAVGGMGPYALLAAVYVATSLLTFFISNTVTAVLMAPIALSAASAAGVSAVPMLMAVTVAASMCFASPFSTPPNALVLSMGGYRPIDYLRTGLPLQVVIGLLMMVALPLLYGF